ncbi:MAG TPA: hypothetical protein VNT03_07505, partial [Baekduia sp.]|nr:hypothetical protein [Baekduia sp.]
MRLLLALWLTLAVAAGSVAGVETAPAATGPLKARAKVKCHWVKATRKRKRHKVCVKVKANAVKKAPGVATAPPAAAT